ncbi:MAG: chorismate synthase [Muribaculaceae bacterium]|nr:chorismate synthase [Muribaculaceae bacterium]
MNNSFGRIFTLTSFGESHGAAVGGVIDGMPAGIEIDVNLIQQQLDRRRPGQSAVVTARDEKDRVELLSGIFEGKTTGQPIGFIVRNTDHHSADYEQMRHVMRPSHADFTYLQKYGIRDHRGGGRSSARETIARVVAGAFARQALQKLGIAVTAYTESIGELSMRDKTPDFSIIEDNPVRCADADTAAAMTELLKELKHEGDTVGGVIRCVVTGVPAGLGDPVFGKLQALLASAMMSINAAKGFEYGMGFEGATGRGSQLNDIFVTDPQTGRVRTLTNNSGGIQGGISNGEEICFRVAFKPIATLLTSQPTVTDTGEETVLKARGRHDPCAVPRAVPIVEAMAAMVLLDAWLMNRSTHI